MMLPVAADLKTFLRIETTDEDALVAQLLTRAQAMVETYMGRPLIAVRNLPTVDDAITHELYARVTTLRIAASRGQIVGLPGTSFVHGPYTITYWAGLSLDPFYGTRIEPLASAAILDVAADLYQRRNPAASQEAAGGGVSVSYKTDAIPERTCRMLDGLRIVAVSAI